MVELSFVLVPAVIILVILAHTFYQNLNMARQGNDALRHSFGLPLVCVFSLLWSVTFWLYSAGMSGEVTRMALYLHEIVILLILPMGTVWLIGKNTEIRASRSFLGVQLFLTGIFLFLYFLGAFHVTDNPGGAGVGAARFSADSRPVFLLYHAYTSAAPLVWGVILAGNARKSGFKRGWMLLLVFIPVLAVSSLALFARFSHPWTRYFSNYFQALIIIVFHLLSNLYSVRFISNGRAADYVFTNVNTPFLFVSPDENIFHANRAATLFFGMPMRELAGKRLADLFRFHDEVPDDLMRPLAGKPVSQRVKLRGVCVNNGAICELFIARRFDYFQEIICAIVDVRDVTERENFIVELEEERKKAEAASQAKSAFLANTSHEIRTPLNAILGMSELALREDLRPAAREHVESIQQAGKNLLSIVNDVLDLSKIEAGKLDIVNREYYFASLLNDCLSIIKTRLLEKPVKFIVDVEEFIPAMLFGADDRVRQVVINLLSNAVKYTEEGSITFSVRAELLPRRETEWRTGEAERQAGEAEDAGNRAKGRTGETEERAGEAGRGRVTLYFSVADTGCGIRKENLEKAFSAFSRFDTHKMAATEGTGLGLAISRRLCRMMGGDITARSVYGQGSVFTAFVTHGVVDGRPFGSLAGAEGRTGAPVYERAGARWIAPDARILIVDDIATNLKVARGLLAPFECEIDLCAQGARAVLMIQEERYDLVFMDHMMPGMDGIEATAAIRAWEESLTGKSAGRRTPIVALTANALSGMKELFLEKGFDGYLAKPIEIKHLNAVMETWIPREKRQKKPVIPTEN
jgi:signal transduction histidine kinase/AmiR/NasT family two-component response regulator